MKKILSVLVSLVMLMSALPFSAYAEEQAEHTHSLVESKTEDESASYTYCDAESTDKNDISVDEKNTYATVNVSRELYPESEHPYSNYAKQNYTFEYPSAVSLTVTFSDKTLTEDEYDLIYVYNSENKVIGTYSGNELAGKTITIDGSMFRLRLWTDHSKTFYGFSIDNIEAKVIVNSYDTDCDRQEIKDSSMYPDTVHDYTNNTDETYHYVNARASSLELLFSNSTKTEKDYDIITIYDGYGNEVGSYSGDELAGAKVVVDGPSFSVRLKTDHSKTFYGYSFKCITAQTERDVQEDFTYPRSPHPYENNYDKTQSYTCPDKNTKAMEVTFSDSCRTEEKYDVVSIYDGDSKLVGSYSGRELAGRTMIIDGNSFSVNLKSDRSKNYYGYAVTKVIPLTGDSAVCPESTHPYNNYENSEYTYTSPDKNAKALRVKFSSKCMTEEKYDVIEIYASNGEKVGSYSGSQLQNKLLTIPGNSFKIKFTSDHSKTFYGFKVISVVSISDSVYDSAVCLESTHPYNNYENSEYIYTSPDKNAKALRVKFSSKCMTEEKYDVIEIYASNGEKVGSYSGSQLQNKLLTIPGNSFKIKFTSDHSKTFYGFKVISVVPISDSVYDSQTLAFPESNHPYENSANEMYRYKSPNPLCRSLKVKFSDKTFTEKDYDIITIYDGNENKIGSYSGDELAGRTLDIDGNEFRIVFSTDHSKTLYGFSIDSVQSVLSTDYYEKTETEHSYALVKDENVGLYRNGVKVYVCRNCGDTYTEEEPSYVFDGELRYALSYCNTVYDGNEHYPDLTVTKKDGTVLEQGTDYDISYSGDGKQVGRYYVSVKLKNGYIGEKSIEFTVKPKGVSSVSVSALLGGFSASWDKQTDNTAGYELQYSQNSNFSSAKTVSVGKNTTNSQKVTGLSRNKTYYVRVRTYRFASDGMKICSDYTAAKSVTTGDCLSLNERAAEIAYTYSNVGKEVFGYSYQGRPLEAYIITPTNGRYNKTYYCNFAIHGFEGESYRDGKYLVAEGNRVVEYYANHPSELKNMRLIVIPCLNPDGVIAGTNELYTGSSSFGRNTANHVDLNRDFNTFNGYESRAIRSLMQKYRPNILCDFHGWLDTSIGNPNMVNIFSDTLGLSRKQPNRYGESYGYLMGYSYKTYGAASLLVEYRNSNISHTNTVRAISKTIAYYN
ncbi:CUB domain-containing protein [uncultured Eubacterium sp.]|uniref:CUB domain-containing protein n=2 Tax=Eubacterium TaxID=1730 RepID=UPI0025D566FB|nr:CUB domain-containing protein [uncultured Eubacterium sp.]